MKRSLIASTIMMSGLGITSRDIGDPQFSAIRPAKRKVGRNDNSVNFVLSKIYSGEPIAVKREKVNQHEEGKNK